MIDWNATLRRWFLIALALTITAVLVRPALSTMLVDRGDVLAYRRDTTGANALYERALIVDATNSTAVDRLLLLAILSHDRARLDRAISIATRRLAVDPGNDGIRLDRALCLQLRKHYVLALRDFRYVGIRSRDARALVFAADDAAKLYRPSEARLLARLAVQVDPEFTPARRALQRFGNP